MGSWLIIGHSMVSVSVIVPVFNAALWIEEALESVRCQSEEFEIIVVDDQSQDGSGDIARRFLDRNGLLGRVIVTDANRGPAYARNLGWQSADAEWIQFLDSDDLLASTKLQLQYEIARSAADDVAVVYSPWQRIALQENQWSPLGPVIRSDVDKDTVEAILIDWYFGYVGPALIRRRALEVVGGFTSEMRFGEDMDLMLRIAISGQRFEMAPSEDPQFLYRDTPGSLWQQSSKDADAVMLLLLAVRNAENYLRNGGAQLSDSSKQALAARYTERLDALQFDDPQNLKVVLGWIDDLHLRSSVPGLSSKIQLAVRLIGLGNALRIRYLLRAALRRLRNH